MSGQVQVSRYINFIAGSFANRSDNIYGNPSYKKHVLYDDFDAPGTDETNDWAVNESHGGTGAINVAKNGTYRLTTSTANDDKAELTRELVWYSEEEAVIEIRVKLDTATTVALCVGLTDAKSYANDQIAFEISGATIVDRATNGVCFAYDTDANNIFWHMVNTKAGTQAGTALTVLPVGATYETFRIALDKNGGAVFMRNGVIVGFKENAITTTTPLTPYAAVISRSGAAARNFDIDYIKCWQNRGSNS